MVLVLILNRKLELRQLGSKITVLLHIWLRHRNHVEIRCASMDSFYLDYDGPQRKDCTDRATVLVDSALIELSPSPRIIFVRWLSPMSLRIFHRKPQDLTG